ncbi:MAG: YraN family protein [Micrococcales bacterium]|nr:YraN family protein [Micrococcales bacterium]
MGTPQQTRPDGRRELGAFGEDLAARFYRDRGATVLDRNWRCRDGEIDLVVLDGATLVVCEVKTRRNTAFGDPVEAVTWRKAARLRRLAAAWLAEQERSVADVRIDVIGVLVPRRGEVLVRHVAGVER